MASKIPQRLGRLSLLILENFVAEHLGDDFVQSLKGPYEKREKLARILGSVENRFVSEHKDADISKALFVDLSQKGRPQLAKAIKCFYDNPALDISFRDELRKILFGEFQFLSRERINKACDDYMRILKEELANEDDTFRSKLSFLVAFRNNESRRAIIQSINDFSGLIYEKSREFVGRDYLFKQVDDFLSNHPRGYFFIIGEPGIGKTAFISQLISKKGVIHHFNSLTESINTPQKFYENICSQLILRYSLDYVSLPDDSTTDARFFVELLNQINRKIDPETKIVIAIDALDEVRHPELSEGANVLFLPQILPHNVYVISTSRQPPKWKIDCEYEVFVIDKMSHDNQKDIYDYLLMKSASPEIQLYLSTQDMSQAEFVRIMRGKSEGNFMYLRHVLPEIASTYAKLDLKKLPQGLRNYYEDHWRRMKGKNQAAWFEYKLPIIMILSAGEYPMSIRYISQILNISASRVADVISEWKQFLNKEEVFYENEKVVRYRFYHLSFIDFLHNQEEVKAEQVDFSTARQNILDYYEKKLGKIIDD